MNEEKVTHQSGKNGPARVTPVRWEKSQQKTKKKRNKKKKKKRNRRRRRRRRRRRTRRRIIRIRMHISANDIKYLFKLLDLFAGLILPSIKRPCCCDVHSKNVISRFSL